MKWHISFPDIPGAFTAFEYSLGDDQENFSNSISGANDGGRDAACDYDRKLINTSETSTDKFHSTKELKPGVKPLGFKMFKSPILVC
jgi:hypothetical protein